MSNIILYDIIIVNVSLTWLDQGLREKWCRLSPKITTMMKYITNIQTIYRFSKTRMLCYEVCQDW